MITIFPTSNYKFQLLKSKSETIVDLLECTMGNGAVIKDWNKLTFKGKVETNRFTLYLYKPIYGSFSLLQGSIDEKECLVEVKINKLYRVLLFLLYLFPLIGFLISLFTKTNEVILGLVFPSMIVPFIIRYVFVELLFRFVSKKALSVFSDVLSLKT